MCNTCFSNTLNTPLVQHLCDRHVDLNLHTVHVEGDVACFYLYNLSGQIVGYQNYNWKCGKFRSNDQQGRYYTYTGKKLLPKHTKTVAVWGLESWRLSKTLFVTEGVFDAARLTRLGYSAVAVLSNDPNTSTLNWLQQVRKQRPTVAVCDPGKAGAKLAKTAHKAHVVSVEGHPDADLGDASDEYVRKLVKLYTE
jgi:hypothetical protein